VLHFITEYGLFLAKAVTIILAIIILFAFIVASISKNKSGKEKLKIKKLNESYSNYKKILSHSILNKNALKQFTKEEKRKNKVAEKNSDRERIFVLDFNGDLKASAISSLREEITAILTIATPKDEVLVRLESPGGLVPCYGLGASQLKRLRDRDVNLTVAVDKISASGGYMMACVANKILAGPYSIIGSIGAIAQWPNFHRLLRRSGIDFEQIYAGKYKRTASLFGENTEMGRKKVQEDVDNVHTIFKEFIVENRPFVNIDEVATGEHWHGVQALTLKLVDELMTSDSYLLAASEEKDIFEVHYTLKKSIASKFSLSMKEMYHSLF
jgi:serine protease SohB